MLPPRTRIPRIGERLLCIDDTGLELGFIKAGNIYDCVSWCLTGKGKYKGHPIPDEVAFSLEGIKKTVKSDGRHEGGCFSARRFVIVERQ